MVLKLYKLDASPPVRAVLMTIEYLGIQDVEYIDVNLFAKEHLTEEFLKLNPQHTIPTLVDDDFVIGDSHAIVTYLVDTYAEGNTLYPTSRRERATVDQRLHFDSGILFPRLRGAVEPILFFGEKAFNPDSLAKIVAAYDLLEKSITSTWLAGDELTLADICCVASVSTLNEVQPIDSAAFPNISAWFQRCKELDFYQKKNEPGLVALRGAIQTSISKQIKLF